MRVDAQGASEVAFLEQGAIARRAIHLRHHHEQGGGRIGRLHFHLCRPAFEGFGDAGNVVLAHLVAARRAEHQRYQVRMLDGQPLGLARQRIAYRGVL